MPAMFGRFRFLPPSCVSRTVLNAESGEAKARVPSDAEHAENADAELAGAQAVAAPQADIAPPGDEVRGLAKCEDGVTIWPRLNGLY
jgi:hypothetical protein